MSDGVLTSETSSQASSFDSNARIICRVCEKQFSQYTCPRCYTRYCSLPCYKSHGLRCTESFMRENVMEEMKLVQHDQGTKSKMLGILRRFHEEEEEENDSMDEDETHSSLSEEILQKVLAGDDISFNDLTNGEKKRFKQALASGELSKLIEPWEPWWLKPSAEHISLSSDGTQLVQPIENDSDNNQSYDIPRGPETPLSPLSKLTSSPPSPKLSAHLVDIAYSYCFTLRLYNGEWRTDPLEAFTSFLTISSVLGQNGQPQTVPETLAHSLEQTCSTPYKQMGGGQQLCVRLVEDVCCLLRLGRSALICMLSDVQRLIKASKRDLKMEKLDKSEKVELRGKLNSTDRKVYFMMCWVNELPFGFWSALGDVVDREKGFVAEHMNSLSGSFLEGEGKSGNRGGKPLIKEL